MFDLMIDTPIIRKALGEILHLDLFTIAGFTRSDKVFDLVNRAHVIEKSIMNLMRMNKLPSSTMLLFRHVSILPGRIILSGQHQLNARTLAILDSFDAVLDRVRNGDLDDFETIIEQFQILDEELEETIMIPITAILEKE
jgi:hypothetical protein